MATPFFSDDFNAPDATLLESYSANWVRSNSTNTGSIEVLGSAAKQRNVNDAVVYANSASLAPSPDYDVSATLQVISSLGNPSVGACGRMAGVGSAPLTFYQARIVNNGSGLVLARSVNGSMVTLLSAPMNFAAGAAPRVTLRMQGNQLSVLLDQVVALGPVTDNSITNAGYTGIRMASANTNQIRIDDLQSSLIGVQASQAVINWTEQSETSSVSATVSVVLASAWAEQSETSSVSIAVASPVQQVSSSISWTEQSETSNTSIAVRINFLAAWTEQGESSSIAIAVVAPSVISLGWTEQPEVSSLAILVQGQGQDFIDAFLVPPRQTVVFEGSRRVVAFEGGKRVVSFEGSKRLVEFQ